MRITGGSARGRRLVAPKGSSVRPTADLIREALFQILTNCMTVRWTDVCVADLFAGTGALGLEALSRGAKEVVFVESTWAAIDAVKRNVESCGFLSRAMLIRADASRMSGAVSDFIRQKGRFDIIMADPPYMQGLSQKTLSWVAEEGVLGPGGVMIVEEFKKAMLPQRIGRTVDDGLESFDARVYGQTGLWFYKRWS